MHAACVPFYFVSVLRKHQYGRKAVAEHVLASELYCLAHESSPAAGLEVESGTRCSLPRYRPQLGVLGQCANQPTIAAVKNVIAWEKV